MSPSFLWLSKFHVKLGVGVKIFKFKTGRWLFYFWFQTCHFLFFFVFSSEFQNLMSSWRWGLGGHIIFEITLCTWVFKYLVPKVVFFFLFLIEFSHFFFNSRNVICRSKSILKFAFETQVHILLLEIILTLTNFTSNRYSVSRERT